MTEQPLLIDTGSPPPVHMCGECKWWHGTANWPGYHWPCTWPEPPDMRGHIREQMPAAFHIIKKEMTECSGTKCRFWEART